MQQYKELKQQVENIQMKKEIVPQGWMNPNWVRAPTPTQLPVIQNQNPAMVQWNQPQGRVQSVYQGEHLPGQNQPLGRVQPVYQMDQIQGQHLGQFPVLFQ